MTDMKKFEEVEMTTPPLRKATIGQAMMHYKTLSKEGRMQQDEAWKKRVAENKMQQKKTREKNVSEKNELSHSSEKMNLPEPFIAVTPPSLSKTVDQIKQEHYQEQIFSFMKPKAMDTSFVVVAKENLADFNQGTFNFAPVKQQKNDLK